MMNFIDEIPVIVIFKIENSYYTNLFARKFIPYELLSVVKSIFNSKKIKWYRIRMEEMPYKNNNYFVKFFIKSMFDIFLVKDIDKKFSLYNPNVSLSGIEVPMTIIRSLIIPSTNEEHIYNSNVILLKCEKENDKLVLYNNKKENISLNDIFRSIAYHNICNEYKHYMSVNFL
ncbi:MAG: hypothetical protein KatS3mg002_1587 [Candidatus Woesearchaeota archaeon]|nr:MAG: hypothetical protein KatS3mg002_1587 [Candidatus Woesearchaeota archaeon]